MKVNKKQFLIVGALIGAINGLLGGGGGMIAVPLLKRFGGMSEKSAHATALAVILPISLFTGAVYWLKAASALAYLLPVCVGSVVGAVVGARLLFKLRTKTVELLFSLVMLLAGLKMLFGG